MGSRNMGTWDYGILIFATFGPLQCKQFDFFGVGFPDQPILNLALGAIIRESVKSIAREQGIAKRAQWLRDPHSFKLGRYRSLPVRYH